eukprot:Lankesteria_metandrocarpae@DN5252_c0_g2_i4.p1
MNVLKSTTHSLSTPLSVVVGYGSFFIPQLTKTTLYGKPTTWLHRSKEDMADFLVVIPGGSKGEVRKWHARNMKDNPKHYSLLARFAGPALTSRLLIGSTSHGTPIHFGSMVRMGRVLSKYAIVSEDHIRRDLRTWSSFFVPGRLHKPIRQFIPPKGSSNAWREEWLALVKANRINALRCALLMLPKSFTFKDLATIICSLSYIGDVRQACHIENVDDKVRRLVGDPRQALEFFALYYPLLTCVYPGCEVNVTSTSSSLTATVAALKNAVKFGNSLSVRYTAERCVVGVVAFGDVAPYALLSASPQALDDQNTSLKTAELSSNSEQLASEILSDNLRFESNLSSNEDLKREMFGALPSSFRGLAARISLKRRFNHILNPISLLKSANHTIVLGSPLPWDPVVLRDAFI